MRKKTTEYIKDMLFCIGRIEDTVGIISFEKYVDKADKKDIVERNLIKMGDIVERIPSEIQEQYENIPWAGIKGLRNRLTHEYPDIKDDIVWDVIIKDLPELKDNLSIVLSFIQEDYLTKP
ncbi:MAG: HepT-like ribonuclease domain-containing protein [Elusimicrobiota bacterium]